MPLRPAVRHVVLREAIPARLLQAHMADATVADAFQRLQREPLVAVVALPELKPLHAAPSVMLRKEEGSPQQG